MIEVSPVLADVCFLRGLDEPTLASFAALGNARTYPRGNVLYHYGDPCHTLYVVITGRVKLGIIGEDGREVALDVQNPGDVCGLVASVDDGPHVGTSITVARSRLLAVPTAHFRAWIAEQQAAQQEGRAPDGAIGRPFNINMIPQNDEITKDRTFFDWRVGAEYDLGKDSMIYATVTTGHKSGGFNDTIRDSMTGLPQNPPQYTPESVTSFEIGSKNTLLERKLRLNASAFFYRYADQVFQTIVTVWPVAMEALLRVKSPPPPVAETVPWR